MYYKFVESGARGSALIFFPVDPEGGKLVVPGKFPPFVAPEPGRGLLADRRFQQVPVAQRQFSFGEAGGVVRNDRQMRAVEAPAALVDPREHRRNVTRAGAFFGPPDK